MVHLSFLRFGVIFCFLFMYGNAASQAGILLQESDLSYLGAFRVPKGRYGESQQGNSFASGGSAISYNATNNSLYISGHVYDQMVAEISIPELINSDTVNDLNTAEILQEPIDIFNGHIADLTLDGTTITEGVRVSGSLVTGNRLLTAVYAYYDAAGKAYKSHLPSSLNLAQAKTEFNDFYRIGNRPEEPALANGGFVGGYMGTIPQAWQKRLRGPALTGLGGIPIITRTSYGPCVWSFSPSDVGVTDPAPASMLLGYPAGHTTLGDYSDTPSLYYNRSTEVRGVVFPSGSDSVLFFGRHGLGITGQGDSCYGEGTDDVSLHMTTVPGNASVLYCYDPADHTKGTHAYPYVYYVWAYDANELAKVAQGEINPATGVAYQPWDILPYAIWHLNFPTPEVADARILGAAYDPQKQIIYISQQSGERYGLEPFPLIHAFQLSLPLAQEEFPWNIYYPAILQSHDN